MADMSKKPAPTKGGAVAKRQELPQKGVIWLQFDQEDWQKREILQCASTQEEAEEMDAFNPHCPWMKYEQLNGHNDRYFEKKLPKYVYFS